MATAAAVARGFEIEPSQVVEADLYLASASQALECLRATPPDVDHVAVVFHNPGASELAQRLLQEPAEINMPTFGIAHVTFDGPWASLAFGQATVQQITSPKALKRHHDQESP